MDLLPGQLVLVKIDFDATIISNPGKFWEEKTQNAQVNKRTIRVKKNDVLLIVEKPIRERLFLQQGPGVTMVNQMSTFLYGNVLCRLATILGFEEYFEPIITFQASVYNI